MRRRNIVLRVTVITTGLIVVAYLSIFTRHTGRKPTEPPHFMEEAPEQKTVTVPKRVRILCWIMTGPQNLDRKAIIVKHTWGKRCDILLFMSSVKNDSFPTIGLKVSEGRNHLTAKTMLAFQHVYENYYDKADWFLKADDDTYVIVDNLRHFLSEQNSSEPVYFGHHFKSFTKQGYMSGGAGYCLSKEALRRFGQRSMTESNCRKDGGYEDQQMGACMMNLGVRAGISTDDLGRSRFHCFNPESHLLGKYPRWYYIWDDHGGKKGEDSISDYAISFHYVSPEMLQILDLCIYHLKVWT